MTAIDDMTATIVNETRQKLREDGYGELDYAVSHAATEVLEEHGDDYSDRLYDLLVDHALGQFDSEWSGELEYRSAKEGKTQLLLDADDCPACGCGIINADIKETAQFVKASGRTVEKFPGETERELYQPDDGPHSPRLGYARCGCCGMILNDPDAGEEC